MKILGIDPGTARTGYGVIKSNNDEVEALDFGCICTSKEEPKEKRLAIIHQELLQLIKTHRPDIMAQELLFFNRNTKTALQVGEARGVILLAAALKNLPIREYTPLQVKDSLTGYGRASKKEVKVVILSHS